MNFIILVTAVSLIHLVICETSSESTASKVNQISTSKTNSALNNADDVNSILLKSIEQLLKRDMIHQTSNFKTIKTAKAQTHPDDPNISARINQNIIDRLYQQVEKQTRDIEEYKTKVEKLEKDILDLEKQKLSPTVAPKLLDQYVVPGAGQKEIVIEFLPWKSGDAYNLPPSTR